jgi:hypothetical protein
VICPPRNENVAMHCISWRSTEVTVHTAPSCPTSVPPWLRWDPGRIGHPVDMKVGMLAASPLAGLPGRLLLAGLGAKRGQR